MEYPSKENYRKLYARYLSENGRSVNELLDLAEPTLTYVGTRVLDLCGGAGEMAKAAFERNAEYVLLVDGNAGMIGEQDPNIHYEWQDVEFFLTEPFWKKEENKFDVVLCRQAVNYWLDKEMAEELASIIHSGGVFAFNTFNRKPSPNPKVKQYVFEGVEFTEVSWLGEDDMVHHVQCREGMAPHTTCFKWIDTAQFYSLLSPWFTITRKTDGATTLYHCKRKVH